MGEHALKSHALGKKHKSRSPPQNSILKLFSQDSKKKEDSDNSASSEVQTCAPPAQSTLDSCFTRDNVLFSEIRWILKTVQSKYSQRSCDGMNELLQTMFPDSEIAKSFKVSRTKCNYIVNHGLSIHFRDHLYMDINSSPYYAISFDESMNKYLQIGQMDLLVRLWNREKNIAETRYLNSEFLGGAKAEQILETFQKGINTLEPNNFLQISSDGPNVNLKFLELFSNKRDFDEHPSLINIGTCGLHTVHGSMKAGIKKSEWNVGKILKALWTILNECPARRELFEKITETNVYPLPYCGHRWCENEKAASRAEMIWPALTKFIKHLKSLPKSKQPQGKSFHILIDAIKDPLMLAKFKLVEYISGKLNKYLRGFQTDQPMIPFLSDTLKDILTSIMKMFILNDTMKKADNVMKLLKIDTSDKNIHKPDKIDVGLGAKIHVLEYKKQNSFKESSLRKFYKDSCNFLSGITDHMMAKSPLKFQLIRCANSIDPNKLAKTNENESCKLNFSKILEKLICLKRITTKVGDNAKEQYNEFIDTVVPRYRERFSGFNKFDQRLDLFFSEFLLDKEYRALWLVCILIFCLFHGQAAVERGFKTNDDYAVQNQSKYSLIALRVINDHMQAKEVSASNIPITRDMVKSVKAARSRYTEWQKEQKESSKCETDNQLKRKVICEEINDVRKKKKGMQESIDNLVKDADKLALEAEQKSDMKLLGRSNDLRKLTLDKNIAIKQLQQMEQTLTLRKESL